MKVLYAPYPWPQQPDIDELDNHNINIARPREKSRHSPRKASVKTNFPLAVRQPTLSTEKFGQRLSRLSNIHYVSKYLGLE